MSSYVFAFFLLVVRVLRVLFVVARYVLVVLFFMLIDDLYIYLDDYWAMFVALF